MCHLFCNSEKHSFVIWCATLYEYQTIQHWQLADNCTQSVLLLYASNMDRWIINLLSLKDFSLWSPPLFLCNRYVCNVNFNLLSISPSFGSGGHHSHLNVNQETTMAAVGEMNSCMLKFVLIKARKLVPWASILCVKWPCTWLEMYVFDTKWPCIRPQKPHFDKI